jgi:hypothetical protein
MEAPPDRPAQRQQPARDKSRKRTDDRHLDPWTDSAVQREWPHISNESGKKSAHPRHARLRRHRRARGRWDQYADEDDE